MGRSSRVGSWLAGILGLGAVLAAGSLLAAESPDQLMGAAKFDPNVPSIALFDGIEQNKLDVQIITHGPNHCQLFLKNTTPAALNVAMPDAFAAVPVIAKLDEPAPQPESGQSPPDSDAPQADDELPPPDGEYPPEEPQSLGVGNAFSQRTAFGAFGVRPGGVAQLKLRSVCLHHGKPGPKPTSKYKVRPLHEVVELKPVVEICRMLGRGEVSHKGAQAAVWHLNNKLAWRQLGRDIRQQTSTGVTGSFTPKELIEAKRAVDTAVQRCANRVTRHGDVPATLLTSR